MKKVEWINGNKMMFDSAHKAFNKTADCISIGNVIGDVQLSSYVRPYNELACNGFTNEPGHLQEFDLDGIVSKLPFHVKQSIRNKCKDEGCWAYHFFYWKGDKRMDIGYAMTHHDHGRWFEWDVYPSHWKKRNALRECMKYVTKEGK